MIPGSRRQNRGVRQAREAQCPGARQAAAAGEASGRRCSPATTPARRGDWRSQLTRLLSCVQTTATLKTELRRCARGPADLPPASTVFGQNRPRDAPSPGLRPPSNLFSSLRLRAVFPATPCNTLFYQIRQNDSPEVEAAVNRLVHVHLWAPVSLSPGPLLSPPRPRGSGGRGHLSKTQYQRDGRALFQDVRKPFPDEGDKPRAPGKPPASGEEPEPGPLGSACPGPAHTAPQLCDFLVSPSWMRRRTVKEMGDPLTCLCRPAAPRLGEASIPLKASSSSTTGSLRAQQSLRGPCGVPPEPRLVPEPLPVVTWQFSKLAGAGSRAVDQRETIKLLQQEKNG